ncbi:hypothetical protein HZS_3506 [Henneguya salminicola]|nr:hypothetical protein HZS_3506 [Henneguya salminicola]
MTVRARLTFLMIEILKENGAKIKDVTIPEMRKAYVSAKINYAKSFSDVILDHLDPTIIKSIVFFYRERKDDPSAKILLLFGQHCDQYLYDSTARQRTKTMKNLKNLFKEVDALILLNTHIIEGHLMFTFLASFCGNPAITICMGYDKITGIPLSIQLITKWWDDRLLIQIAHQIEQKIVSNKQKPNIFNCSLIKEHENTI